MLGNGKIVAFAATNDAGKAVSFYKDKLGLQLVADEPFALVFNVNGSMLRIQKVTGWTPPQFTVLGWEVGDIKQTISLLVAQGVEFMRIDGFEQDDLGIWSADIRTKVAWFRDPDGSILSLTEFTTHDAP